MARNEMQVMADNRRRQYGEHPASDPALIVLMLIRKLKALAVCVGVIAAGCAFWYLILEFLWLCYYAGIPM